MAFSRFSEFDEQELNKLLENRDADNTKKTVKASVAVLQHYLQAKGKDLFTGSCCLFSKEKIEILTGFNICICFVVSWLQNISYQRDFRGVRVFTS